MGLLRFLLLCLLGFIAYRCWVALTKRPPRTSSRPTTSIETMVKCAQCDLHLPQHDAIYQAGQWFCCEAHQRDFMKAHPS